MTKPKVALCISGQPRSWEIGYSYYQENLLGRNDIDVDVYIHTWNHPKVKYDQILAAYKPALISIEKPLLDNNADIFTHIASPKHPAITTYSSFYSIFQAYSLCDRESPLYDWVIRTRFDYALNGRINFDGLDTGIVYVPNCRMTPERDFCNDQFAYGSPTVMKMYCSTYNHLYNLYSNNKVIMNGEDMLAANLKQYKLIGPNMVYVDMHNPFPPGQYNSTWHSLIRDDLDEWRK